MVIPAFFVWVAFFRIALQLQAFDRSLAATRYLHSDFAPPVLQNQHSSHPITDGRIGLRLIAESIGFEDLNICAGGVSRTRAA